MTTSARGRHRKLRRNILHTVIATALLAGTFTVVDQTINSPTASATANGSDDTTFNAGIASSSPGNNVVDIAQDSSGNTYAAYTTFVKKYDPAGNILWTSPTSSNTIRAIAVTASGVVYVATAQGFRILNLAGTTWDSVNYPRDQNNNSNNQGVTNVGVWATNKILYSGSNGNNAWFLGSTDLAGGANTQIVGGTFSAAVTDFAFDSSNRIYVVGSFPGYIKRVTAAGAIDSTFVPPTFTAAPTNVAVSSTGLVAVSGPSGVGRLRVLSSTGAETTTFGSSLSGQITSDLAQSASDLVFDASGRLLVGGSFGLVLINTDGTKDTNFVPTTSGSVNSIVVQTDEEIVVGMSNSPFVKRVNPVWGVPNAPPTPTAAPGDRSATVTVAAGTGITPKSIIVTASPGGATCTISAASGSCVVPGLTNGTAYTFTAVAVNVDKTSTASAASTAVTPIDTVKPVLVSASSAGAVITLTFNEPISSTTAALTAFGVTLTPADATITRSSVSVSGNTVQITMSKAIPSTTSVAVTYTSPTQVNPPTANHLTNAAVQDLVGNDVNTFTSPTFFAGDITSPVLASSAVGLTGRDIALTFTDANNLFANTSNIPATSAFSVDVNGTVITPTQVSITANTKIVNLTLGMTIDSNDVVKVSYTAPASVADVSNIALQDTSGNDVAAFADAAVTNNSSVPALLSINVSTSAGTTVILTYNETLHATTAPASAFTVVSGGRTTTPTSAVVSGSTVTLTLPTGVEGSGTVVVNYTAPAVVSPPTVTPTTNLAIQDSLGYDATSFPAPTSPVVPTNNSTVDTLPPVFVSGYIAPNGTDMVLTFNENIKNASSFRADPWKVEVNGTNLSIQQLNTTISGNVITVPLNTLISSGQTVRFSYVKQNNTMDISDLGGRMLVNFGPVAIENNSAIDRVAPVLQSIEVPTTGDRLILKYNEAMGSTFPAVNTTNFGVTVGGVAWLPTSMSVDGENIILNGPATIEIGKTVVLTKYTAPTANVITTNAAIQDTSGNDAASLSNRAVTNKSTLDITAPTVSAVTTNTSGTEITVTFNEPLSELNPPLATQFSVANTGGYATTVSGVRYSGSAVILTLSTPLGSGTGKTISYTASSPVDQAPGNPSIEDVAGNDVATFTNRTITNTSTIDQIAPTVSSVTTNTAGNQITVTFNEPLSDSNPPSADQFTVANTGGYPVTVSGVTVSGSTVVLTLSGPLSAGTGKNFSYTASTPVDQTPGNAAIQDLSGNDSLAITNQVITNSSTVDQTSPLPVTTNSVKVSQDIVTITFDEALQSSPTAAAGAYSVTVGATSYPVSAVTVNGKVVELTLSSAIPAGATVRVVYTPPTPANVSNTNSALQDSTGNDVLTFDRSSTPYSSTWAWTTDSTKTSGSNICGNQWHNNGNPFANAGGVNAPLFLNSARSTTLSNGVRYSIGVSGSDVCIGDYPEAINYWYGLPSQFTQTRSITDPGVSITTSHVNCGSAPVNTGTTCANRGVVTINFDRPITNPVIAMSGMGGYSNNGSLSWSEFSLLTPGVTLSTVSGTNIKVTNGNYIEPVNKRPWMNCDSATGSAGIPSAVTNSVRATAMCGTVLATGTMTSLSFQVNLGLYGGQSGGNAWYDQFAFVVTTSEDFGLAPVSYDAAGVASHVVSQLKLGALVELDHPTSNNVSVNPDAVAAGTSLAGNPKADDGFPGWATSPSVYLEPGSNYSVTVALGGVTGSANLCGWIDFNRNGTFDTGERTCAPAPSANATSAKLTWTIPAGVAQGLTYARLRLSYDPVTFPTGKVGSGEVEDYSFTVVNSPTLASAPTADNETSTGALNMSQSASILIGDATNTGIDLTIGDVELWDPATSTWVTTKVSYANGTYEIVGNEVVFVPTAGFTGQAESLLYRITDSNGKTAQATYTPTVTPPAPPVCTSDLLINGSFEEPALGAPNRMGNFGQGTVPGWRTTASDGQIEIWSTTFNNVPSIAGIPGNQFAELNANFVSTLYQDVATVPGSTISWSFAHRGREGTDTMRLIVGAPGSSLTQVGSNFVDGNTAWGRYSGSYTVPAGQTTTRFAFESVSSAGGPTLGNFIDDVKIGPVGACVTAEKSVTPSGPANVGSELTYSIKVTNTDTSGRSTVGLAVTDVIPANTTYVAGSLTPAGGTVTGSTVTIPITGNGGTSGVLEPGVSKTISFKVLIGSGAAGTVVTNTASVSQTSAGLTTIAPVSTNSVSNTVVAQVPPVAGDDTSTGSQNQVQRKDILTNDSSSTPADLTITNVGLWDPVTSTWVTTKVTYANGTYEIQNGQIVFTPNLNYVGVAEPLKYKVTNANGLSDEATYTPTVVGPSVAFPDAKTDDWDTNQVYAPASNDSAATGGTLTATSVRICATGTPAASCTGTTLTIDGQGTYTVDITTGEVTFNPLPTFHGAATPIQYVVTDSQNEKVTSTISPTVRVPDPPVGLPNPNSDGYDKDQIINPISDDTANPNFPLLANSVKLCGIDPVETPNTCTKTTLVVPGEGTYTVNPDGTVTFNPLPTFTGTVLTPVKYQAKDSLNRFVSESITPTVGLPPVPTDKPDVSDGLYDINQVISPLANVTPGDPSFPALASSLKLCALATTDPPVPAEVPNNCTQTTLEVPGEGTYTVNPDGTVTFNPLPTFTGPATPIKYQAKDKFDRFVDSTISTTVGPPPAPVGKADTSSEDFDVDQFINPLTNDVKDPNFPLNPASVKLCGTNPAQTPNNCTQTALVIEGEGTYTVDPVTGIVKFDPLPTFTGPATQIKYQASDSPGRFVDSTISVTVGSPPPPVANPDTSYGAKNATQVFNPLADDTVTSGFPLDPESVKLCGKDPVETPNNCTKTTLTVAEGTFTVDPVTGYVTFVPVTDYIGDVPTISYVVSDSLGRKTNSTIDVTVAADPAMTAKPDTSIGNYNTPQTINPLTNDSAGKTVGITGFTSIGTVSIDATSVRFCGPGQLLPDCDKTTFTNAAGTYAVDPATGVVTFTPAATFTGTDVNGPTYQVCNIVDANSGWDPVPAPTCATAQIVPTVGAPPVPVARPDTDTTLYDTNKTINPLTSDTANANFPLDPTSVKLCGAGQTPGGTPDCDKTTLEVFGEGTYTVNPVTGEVTFNPLPTFTGTTTPISYQVSDSLDRTVGSTIALTVGDPPPAVARPDVSSDSFDKVQTISPLGNDSAGNASFPIDPTSLKLCGPDDTATSGIDESIPPNCNATTLEVPNVGTYTVKPNGTVEFDPLPTFTGDAPAVKYQVEDSKDRVIDSTITATVGPPPVAAANDTSSGAWNEDQIIDVLNNDTVNTDNPDWAFDPTSVRLCGLDPVQTPNACDKTTLEVPGEGTYTVNPDGTVTFNPLSTFTGTVKTPVSYQVTDELDRTVSAKITPSVDSPPLPTALPDTSTGIKDANQSVNLLTNPAGTDAAGIAGLDLDPTSVRLCAIDNPATTTVNEAQTPPNCTLTELVVPGVGTYTVDATGQMTFDPLPAYTGTPAPVKYIVKDETGQVDDSTYTPTVLAPPTVKPDTSVGPQGAVQTRNVITNAVNTGDSANDGATLDLKTLAIDCPNPSAVTCTVGPDGEIIMAGQGTYTIDPATPGSLIFTPEPDFKGTAVGVTYSITDSNGQTSSSTYTPSVVSAPTAKPDTSTGQWNTPQSINVVNNAVGNVGDDLVAPGYTLVPASVVLSCPTSPVNPDCSTATVDGKVTVTIADQGTYSVNPAQPGTVIFTPVLGFQGPADPVTYTVSDNLGQTTSTTYTPTVTPPNTPPTVAADTSTGPWNTPQSRNVLTNSVGTGDSATARSALDPDSVALSCTTAATPTCVVNGDGTVTITGQGTYSLDPTDPGVVIFTPLPTFTGAARPIKYTVEDVYGLSNSTTYTPTVSKPPLPTALPDTSTGIKDANQSVNLLTNPAGTDTAGIAGLNLDPTSVRLCAIDNPATTTVNEAQTPPNCTLTTLTVPGVGTYTVDATGLMTFDPLPTYVGTPAPVKYIVKDETGQVANSTYTPTVIPAPVAVADTSKNGQDINQTINILSNDTVPANGNALDPTSVKLCALADAAATPAVTAEVSPNCSLTELTVPGEGKYSVNPTTGVVTFDPEPNFTGTATKINYQVSDTGTGANKQTTTATITPTVVPAPTARPDTTTGGQGLPQSTNLLTNTAGSDAAAPGQGGNLVPASVRLCDISATPAQVAPDCTVAPGTPVVVAGVGSYSVSATGVMTFTPEPGFTGTPAVLPYTVADNYGVKATSTYTPTVVAGPDANPDTTTGGQGLPQTINLLTNTDGKDTAADGATLVASSVKLCAPPQVAPNCNATSVTVTGVGTYSVSNTGVMTFTPVAGYTGTPTPLAYTVLDSNGVKADSTYTPTVIAKPVARPDTTTGNKDVNQVVNLVTNPAASGTDAAGIAGLNLDPTTVRLCKISPAETPPNCTATTLTVAGVGTYTVDATGQMTFDPAPNYTGTPAPVKYIVKDEIGQVADSTYTPTVLAPPTVKPDTSVGPQNTAQTRNVITNTVNTGDSAISGATLVLASLAISCPNPSAVTCTVGANGEIIMAGQGTYTIDSKNPGELIFTPESGFTGTAVGVQYSITDSNGQTSSTTYTPTVIPAPIARDDNSVAEQGATQWISPLGNDSGSAGGNLLPGSVFLCRVGEPPPDCEATEVVIVGQGTFTVSSFGVVKFVPEPGFTGPVTPLTYQVADEFGQKTDAVINVEVLPPPSPSATMDTGSADYNKSVTLQPWLNDFAGLKPKDSNLPAPELIASSIRLCGEGQKAPNCTATKVTTADGTYVLDKKTGEVVFTPVKGFIGTVTAPVTYQISNNWSGSAGPGVTTSILVPTINPPGSPAADVDVTETKPGVSVVIVPVDNDTPGGSSLNPRSIKLCGLDEISPECSKLKVTTLDGTYVVNEKTGEVTFSPRKGFTGKATIPYVIWDMQGQKANSNIIITVKEAAKTKPTTKKPGLADTGGTRPDLLLLLGLVAIAGAGGLRAAGRKRL